MLELAEIYIEALKGFEKSKMEFITDQVITLKGDKVYMYTRNRIEWHKKQGHLVFFISGSPDYLVQRMGEKYGVTESIGTTYLLDDNNRYTGEVIQMWDSKSKLETAKKLVEKYDIDLTSSYAYGDTNGDISMFDLVANPIAINPSRELMTNLKTLPEIAEKLEVIVERKDCIYKLDSNVELVQVDEF
jgi:HAD superfamily hydrolase (TIGR01490 family)